MFKLIGTTLKITQGDTGELEVTATGATFGSSAKAQLTVTDRAKTQVLQKIVDITNNVATFEFDTADTAELDEGVYLWELRFVDGATVTEGVITAGTYIGTPHDGPMTLQIIDALGDIGVTEGD